MPRRRATPSTSPRAARPRPWLRPTHARPVHSALQERCVGSAERSRAVALAAQPVRRGPTDGRDAPTDRGEVRVGLARIAAVPTHDRRTRSGNRHVHDCGRQDSFHPAGARRGDACVWQRTRRPIFTCVASPPGVRRYTRAPCRALYGRRHPSATQMVGRLATGA